MNVDKPSGRTGGERARNLPSVFMLLKRGRIRFPFPATGYASVSGTNQLCVRQRRCRIKRDGELAAV